MIEPIKLPTAVHWTKRFQETVLINRAVLDTFGYALPMIVLARNAVERKEKLLDRAMVIGSAFFLAPLHAWAFLKYFSRDLSDPQLMQVSYRHLKNNADFRSGLEKTAAQIAQDSQGKTLWQFSGKLKNVLKDEALTDTLRKTLIRKKSHMLLFDLLIEALIFTNIRFITNWFGQKISGRKQQFSGELGVVDEAGLTLLKQQQQKRRKLSQEAKQAISTLVALIVPPALGKGIEHALLHPEKDGRLVQMFRKLSPHFDYKRGIYLSLGSLVVVVAMQFLGYLMASRDRHELSETFVRENVANYVFFAGTWTWMKLLANTVLRKSDIPADTFIQRVIDTMKTQKAPVEKIQKAAKRSAGFYGLSFLLNAISAGAIIVGNNWWTAKRVKKDVNTLQQQTKPPKPIAQPAATRQTTPQATLAPPTLKPAMPYPIPFNPAYHYPYLPMTPAFAYPFPPQPVPRNAYWAPAG